MSTTKSKKNKSSYQTDFSLLVDTLLMCVSCVEHSQKPGMFITKFISKLSKTPMKPFISFGFEQYDQGQLLSMYKNTKGFYTLTDVVDTSLYEQLQEKEESYNSSIQSLMSLQ